jgi:hypothetical protein
MTAEEALASIDAINAKFAAEKERRLSGSVVATLLNKPSEKTVRFAGTFMGCPIYLDPDMPDDVVRFLYERLNG